ncbi:selenium metabolism protein YedF [Thermotomaculum hydrothermale]|uniref:Selenium metabolism protein YedF n=1 Tax=Thermotomaculum hydrothermale TaxID=981385 RepID=A0A7R6SY59_9BACT|nr:sulfurtransferase-like selenium metabolism protein YedF [Thermotomaculum hydrothermale]BBB32429.1 selenium metabolism protein YedF [Thermotomaculum hydrothermale]
MAEKIVDAKGLACPQPVIMTKNALSEIEEGIIKVLVDSIASRENVKRFAESQGCTVEIKEKDGVFEIEIVKGYQCGVVYNDETEESVSNKVVFVSSDAIGPDYELGKELMKGFLKTFLDLDKKDLPKKMIFVNKGVHITCFWEETIEHLKELEKRGVEIYSCGACLNYFKITDELKVGQIGNAFDSVQSLMQGESVINLG